MSKCVAGSRMLMGVAVAALLATPLAASAHDHDGWGHRGDRDRGGWHEDRGYDRGWHDRDDWHHRGGYWSGGRWIAGAVVAGAVAGLVETAVAPPPPVYYAPPQTVVYTQPTVVYESAPVVTRTVVYSNGY